MQERAEERDGVYIPTPAYVKPNKTCVYNELCTVCYVNTILSEC